MPALVDGVVDEEATRVSKINAPLRLEVLTNLTTILGDPEFHDIMRSAPLAITADGDGGSQVPYVCICRRVGWLSGASAMWVLVLGDMSANSCPFPPIIPCGLSAY